MTGADHIRALAKLSAECVKQDTKAAVARSKRDRAIREASKDGVSYMAIAIAVNVTKSLAGRIAESMFEPPTDQDPVHSLGIHALSATYPCCGNSARFMRDEMIDPGATHVKTCPSCERQWTVTRTVLASTARGRVDELHWTIKEDN